MESTVAQASAFIALLDAMYVCELTKREKYPSIWKRVAYVAIFSRLRSPLDASLVFFGNIACHPQHQKLKRSALPCGCPKVATEDCLKRLKTGYVRYDDLPLKAKTGAIIDVEFVSNSYSCEGIKVNQCNIRKISERKLAEAKLHRQTQLYLALNQGNYAMMQCATQMHLNWVLWVSDNGSSDSTLNILVLTN